MQQQNLLAFQGIPFARETASSLKRTETWGFSKARCMVITNRDGKRGKDSLSPTGTTKYINLRKDTQHYLQNSYLNATRGFSRPKWTNTRPVKLGAMFSENR